MAYPIASLANGGVLYSDGSVQYTNASSASSTNYSSPPPAPAPTPIASQADGTVLWSDGSVTGTPYTSSEPSQPSQPSQPRPTVDRPANFTPANYSSSAPASFEMPSFSSLLSSFTPQAYAADNVSFSPTPVPTPTYPPSFGKILGTTSTSSNPFSPQISPSQSYATSDSSLASLPVASSLSGLTLDKYGNELKQKSNDFYQKALSDYGTTKPETFNSLNPDPYMKEYNDLLAIFDDVSSDDYARRQELADQAAGVRRKYLEDAYGQAETTARSQIPLYEKYRDEGVTNLKEGLAEFKETGETQKTNVANRYGDLIRRETANKRVTDAERRNMFSALGTAESSAFIDSQRIADQAYNDSVMGNEKDRENAIQTIDKEILKQEGIVNGLIDNLQTDAQTKIDAVLANINMNQSEKMAKLEELNIELQQNMLDLTNTWNDQKNQMLQYQMELAGSRSLIAQQGDIDQALLRTQAQIAGVNSTLASQMPPELELQLRQFSAAPSSSNQNYALKEALKKQYPSYADIIEGVFTGGIVV